MIIDHSNHGLLNYFNFFVSEPYKTGIKKIETAKRSRLKAMKTIKQCSENRKQLYR